MLRQADPDGHQGGPVWLMVLLGIGSVVALAGIGIGAMAVFVAATDESRYQDGECACCE